MVISKVKNLNKKNIIKIAKKVLKTEAAQVLLQCQHIDESFVSAVELVYNLKGKIVVIGIGKSGLVGRKIASTFSSLNIPAVFLHPVELLHGDLGLIKNEDIVLALSYSGQTEELKKVLPVIKNFGIKVIAFTKSKDSKLAKFADVVVKTQVRQEACPYNIVPTSSTTAMLAMGDALAITVAVLKGFKKEDFARVHPSGSLGKQLTLMVKDIMRTGKLVPKVKPDTLVKDALLVMTSTKLGATTVVGKNNKLIGYFTDGDFRRKSREIEDILYREISEVMTKNPKVATPQMKATEAKEIMKKFNCDNLPVVDHNGRVVGIIDERDILQEGI
ncbi:MAG: KpsF/GutQ family sugar-phosphate isomerase [Endomicrobia bacterium]|nr:KpsF/GutQ family sugar-phosphate isomerase [Endomicrobiia bacterium]MCX7940353.1 KpsF/GutQ family sugar-phosphate isomerase [Endomicrobiia bacterium]MDW8055216.1 KpsF/GutQ family sugar-phosphate isomerase [Elusimicrobiota bacterium]